MCETDCVLCMLCLLPFLTVRAMCRATGETFKVADAPPFLWSFLNAAYDTTASTIAFTTYYLSRNPDALHDLREELARHGPDAVPAAGSLADWPVAEVRGPLL